MSPECRYLLWSIHGPSYHFTFPMGWSDTKSKQTVRTYENFRVTLIKLNLTSNWLEEYFRLRTVP